MPRKASRFCIKAGPLKTKGCPPPPAHSSGDVSPASILPPPFLLYAITGQDVKELYPCHARGFLLERAFDRVDEHRKGAHTTHAAGLAEE